MLQQMNLNFRGLAVGATTQLSLTRRFGLTAMDFNSGELRIIVVFDIREAF